jgi:hypothetical protein
MSWHPVVRTVSTYSLCVAERHFVIDSMLEFRKYRSFPPRVAHRLQVSHSGERPVSSIFDMGYSGRNA